MIICDTNIILELFKNKEDSIEKFKNIGTENLSISAITVGEFYFGALDKRELQQILKHLLNYEILNLTPEITLIFLELMKKFSLSHRPFIGDMLIAATALYFDYPLLTLNVKDFQYIPNLRLAK
jgi:predicted nucleic acid-binding protein